MDHMFDELIGSERQSATSWQPAIELQDTEDNLMLRAETGVDGDIDIHVTREAAYSGEHRFEKKTKRKASSPSSATAISSVWFPCRRSRTSR